MGVDVFLEGAGFHPPKGGRERGNEVGTSRTGSGDR